MRHCRVAILGLCLVLTAAANSQAPDDLLREAEIAFSNGQFPEALGIYLMAKQLDPDNTDVLLPLAECYLENGEPEPALPLLKQVINSRRPDPRAYLLTAQALHLTNQYELAIQAYKGYLQRIPDDDPSRPVAKADILRCGFATRWQHSEAVAFVDNLGDMVNSDSDETAPALSPNHPDRLYFSSNREGASGGKRNMEGIADPLGQRKLDLFMTEQRPQGWTAPSPLASPTPRTAPTRV